MPRAVARNTTPPPRRRTKSPSIASALAVAEVRIEDAAKIIQECAAFVAAYGDRPEGFDRAEAEELGSRFAMALEVLRWQPSAETQEGWRKVDAVQAGEDALT